MGGDRTPPVRRRTTVAEAAEVLGISAEAVRGRIRRGTLPVEREGGTVYVLLDRPAYNRTTDDQPRTTDDQPRTTDDRPDDRTDALLATYRERVEDLWEQLLSERQAHAEARRLLATALERTPPQLEAPPEAPESPETATAEATEVSRRTSVDAGSIGEEALVVIGAVLAFNFVTGGFGTSILSAIKGYWVVSIIGAIISALGIIGGVLLTFYLARRARNLRQVD